ncbi:MAG: bacteriochlorophyll 4-vinyl reductase [Rhodobacteraceae bacterium]|nr:bacteriochlorophyll 4-vinyl reductase [Paracoccaceae bacterium]
MPDGGQAAPGGGGRIGPNAILQLVAPVEAAGGEPLVQCLLAAAGLDGPPAADGLIPEVWAARMHRELRRLRPDAAAILREAGARTGRYILARRIPAPARAVLRTLPAVAAAPLLARAIEKHAWTFAGSGRFAVTSTRPPVLELAGNPLIRGEEAGAPLCHWHAAVFTVLFRALADPHSVAVETACAACGAPACRFEISVTVKSA